MREILNRLKQLKAWKRRLIALVLVLSLGVAIGVPWILRLPGLTVTEDFLVHTHNDSCGTRICICDLPEEAHVHDDLCYEMQFVEEQAERRLICQETEQPHIHHEGCYLTEGDMEPWLICDIVTEPHVHTESCFEEEIIEAHEERVLVCSRSEEVHIHDDSCYTWNITCGQEETIRSRDYSDETADVETPLEWQKMFEHFPYTENLRENLVGIAEMQVGYTESTLNYAVSYDGTCHGYTRYGARYGAPYKEWSALFVSFCLYYAGADPEELPTATEGAKMRELWDQEGRTIPSEREITTETYIPSPGDLVFFADDTVGIVVMAQNATCHVICGDLDDAVRSITVPMTDEQILCWGTTEGAAVKAYPGRPESEPQEDPSSEETPAQEEDALDISDGPVFTIVEGEADPKLMRMGTFSLLTARTVTELIPYLEARGGSYFFTLLDSNNQELPKDDNGNYVVQAETGYKLTLSFTSPEGFLPGVYEYQIPNGLLVDGGEGSFILKDGTNVGTWVVTDEGLITLDFNENINSRTDITISATLGIRFPAQDEPIDFDGKITVTIEKPVQELEKTQVYKWGSQGNEATDGKTDTSKLYWTVYIVGKEGSQLPGSTLTDAVIKDEYLGEHHYVQSDMDAGLTIGISEYDPVTGAYLNWHSYTVYPGDPNLTWEEDSWTYTIPETAFCQWCGEIALGSNAWEYYVEYTSTPKPSVISGALGYMNHVTVDGQQIDGWAEFTHGEILADVEKMGTFRGDAEKGAFYWEFQAIIPGMKEGQKAEYFWYIMDYMDVRTSEGSLVAYIENDANTATVTATHNGTVIEVPRIQDATEDDPFAWQDYWSADHGDGIYYGRQLNLLCRCNCNETNCQFWNGYSCESEYWYEADDGYWYTNGYCQCWTEQENTSFTFSYETRDLATVETYGGMGNQLRNEAVLYNMIIMPNGSIGGVQVAYDSASVPIPELFHKVLVHDFDGYTANYKITINEAKLVLNDGSPLTIHDMMTETLAFISGSLVITAEDAQGNVTVLKQDEDYTVEYDGTGGETDENGNPIHLLKIVILQPQPVMYTLDYDATLIIPPGTTQAIKYNNSAKITIWDEDITDSSTEKVFADINIAAKNYRVELFKTAADTGDPLGGATFGLFNEHGGLITTEVTDAKGGLAFQTNIIQGIILRDHVLYYMQEQKAPAGYQLDDTMYWFCFCDKAGGGCKTCEAVMEGTNAFRIPDEQIGKVQIKNELMRYVLPATGGPGTFLYTAGGAALISAATVLLLYKYKLRRKEGEGPP